MNHFRSGMIFFTYIRAVLSVGLIPFVLVGFVGEFAYNEYYLEKRYQEQHGESWKQYFEEKEGPLQEKRLKIVIGVGGTMVAGVITVLIFKQFAPSHQRRRY